MNEKEMFYTAGQFAKLHGINKRTLHYYDEIGLFSPAHKGVNGYRYYTYLQSPNLEMLLALRELEMSVEDILMYMQNRSPDAFEEIVNTKIHEVEFRIRQLQDIHKMLTKKKTQLTICRGIDFNKIETITCEQEYLSLTKSMSGDYDLEDFSILIAHPQETSDTRIFNKTYGSMISVENIYAGKFENYTCFFTQIEKPKKKADLYIKPAGNYIRAFCLGPWENLASCYAQIISYAQLHELTLCGYAYEIGINEMSIGCMEEYVTQIMIQYK
ncbi:MAG: MerR family DNA-binding transcriptional regulator [Longicatena sp.]